MTLFKPQPTRKFNLSLMLLMSLNLLPHLEEHKWITLLFGVSAITWRGLHEFQRVKLPSFFIKLPLVTLAFYLCFQIYGQITGAEAATALLIAGVCLKLLDSSNYHDAMVLLFLNFLLLMSRFLVSQTLAMTLLGVINLILITALLVQLHKGRELQLNFLSLLKLGGKLLFQTSPLLILLFFVFPRFSTGFFHLNNENVAKSGFSDNLSPGGVAKLVTSDEVAFRVEFTNRVPLSAQRYWRGAVLKVNKGMNWEIGKSRKKINYSQTQNSQKWLEQNIILEPRYGTWLFGLDSVVEIKFKDSIKQMQSYEHPGNIFSIKHNNGQKLNYKVLSDLNNQSIMNQQGEYLQMYEDTDPRLFNLVQSVTTQAKSDLEVRDLYLKYFRENIKYTLSPKVLVKNTVSEFLFDSKEGFCEHMAASFAYLLRASGVPARVVVGFHGGQKNDFGEHYVVKDKDAHA
ncbi:MAG: DUF3488 domain-containing transglutaminase family protein, partial [Bdellovibrionales bacterium]|nr:DUF3488 domain-containing transglutaminase family protein [Bdellovibrionales bacterium]